MNPMPPVQMAITSQIIRTRFTSTSKYRAKPAQTPAIFLFRLSNISFWGAAAGRPTPVRVPHREQKQSSSCSSTPHCVKNIVESPPKDTHVGPLMFQVPALQPLKSLQYPQQQRCKNKDNAAHHRQCMRRFGARESSDVHAVHPGDDDGGNRYGAEHRQ